MIQRFSSKFPLLCALAFPTGFASVAGAADKIDFEKQIAPLLEDHCLKCHGDDEPEKGYSVVTKEAAFKKGFIVPGDPDDSDFYWFLITDDKDEMMPPPAPDGAGPLKDEQKELFRKWIEEGAEWPEGVEVGKSKGPDFITEIKPILEKLSVKDRNKIRQWIEAGAVWPPDNPDTIDLAKKIREKIVATTKVTEAKDMVAYTETITGTGAKFDLVPIPGGTFKIGSPETEKNRKATEGPQQEVKISPFWMGKLEVTWDEYGPFSSTEDRRTKEGAKMYPSPDDTIVDMVSRPTKEHLPMNFGMPKEGHPAIAMTQHAASKYCEWLSAQTGHYYRLPTEAEWEYACRAGTTTQWSWGDDPKQAGEYAWFLDNANYQYQKCGVKKPNPWGLYDMHGNVGEWVLDYMHADGYKYGDAPTSRTNPWVITDKLYPRVVRGGSWRDLPGGLRSASRLGSAPLWKLRDPQFPKSIWYHTEPMTLGFRVVRPLDVPDAETMFKMWNSGVEHDGTQE